MLNELSGRAEAQVVRQGAAVSAGGKAGGGELRHFRAPTACQPTITLGGGGDAIGVLKFNKGHLPIISPDFSYCLDFIAAQPVIFGFPKLRRLLQPQHSYFTDKQAYITGFKQYRHRETDNYGIYYPMVSGDKKNPYCLHKRTTKLAGRTVGSLSEFIQGAELHDFRLAQLVPTFPQEMSKELARRGAKGRVIAWSVIRKWFLEDVPRILRISGQLGATANLHVWKTENPLLPHFHAHILLANYAGGAGGYKKFFGRGIPKWYQREDGKRKRGYVPVSNKELEQLKLAWAERLRASCQRNQIACVYLESSNTVVIEVDYAIWQGRRRGKLIHKLTYGRRDWLEDYAEFTFKNAYAPGEVGWI